MREALPYTGEYVGATPTSAPLLGKGGFTMSYPVRLESALQHIHEGKSYTKFTGAPLGLGGSATISFTTPVDCCVHFRLQVQVALAMNIAYYQHATVSGGTIEAGFNKNFNSVSVHQSIIRVNPTIDVVGDMLMSVPYGAGNKAGGLLAWDEYVFEPSSTYYMTVSSAVASNNFSSTFNWVEDHN